MTTVTTTAPEGRRVRLPMSRLWMPLILLALIAAFSIAKPDAFLSTANFRGIVLAASFLILMTVGQTFVLTIGGIDLSVGSILVFSSVVGSKVMAALGATADASGTVGGNAGTVVAGIAAALIVGLAWGILNGVLVAFAHIPSLIVTLGSYGAALGLSQVITGGSELYNVPPALTDALGNGSLLGVPNQTILAILVAIIAGLLLWRTRFGYRTKAIGSNIEAARRSGIRVGAHTVRIYAISGLLAGGAAVLTLAEFGATSVNGHSADNLSTIAAAVLGGTSLFGGAATIIGSVVGVFVPVVLQSGFVILGIQAYWQTVAVGVVLVVAVFIDQFQQRRRSAG